MSSCDQPLPNVANVQDQSMHPVYVRTGSGDFYDGIAFRYAPYWHARGGGACPGTPPCKRSGMGAWATA